MNPFSYIDTSPEEEKQNISKYLKILESLGEHASSYLYQKGVVLGDDRYQQYEQKLEDEKYQKFVVNTLLRPGDKNSEKQEVYPAAAIYLLQLASEARQIFLDVRSRPPQQTGTCSGIITLGYHLALMERITAFLGLPSLNDRSYWNLMTGAKNAAAKEPNKSIPPVKQPPPTAKTPAVSSPPERRSIFSEVVETVKKTTQLIGKSTSVPAKQPAKEPARAPAKASSTAPANAPVKAPARAPVKAPVKASTLNPQGNKKDGNSAVKKAPAKQQTSTESQSEGPIKAMVRRIVKEINDDSYDAVLAALKDNKLMMDLYKCPNDPIAVKVLEVDTKERKVHLIKKKLGPKESVSFRLIRKMLAEL